MFKRAGLYASCGLAWALAGCQSVCRNECVRPLPSIDYTLVYRDDPAQRRLHVTVTSKSKRRFCLGREWPSSGSLVTEAGASTGVYLFADHRIFAYASDDSLEPGGYCIELHCYNPMRLGEHRDGYLSYDGFGLPVTEYGAEKILKFKPQPFWC